MNDRGFTHPNFGSQVRIEQDGKEVRLTFVSGTRAQADSLFDTLLSQLKNGALNITLMGKPTNAEEVSVTSAIGKSE